MKEMMDYKLYPKSKERLIEEIIKAFDDYDNDELGDDVFLNLMSHYQNYSSDEKFIGDHRMDADLVNNFEVNSSTRKRIGKSRSDRLEKILTYQSTSLF